MAEAFFLFLFAIPALLGVAEIMHTVRLWIYGIGKQNGALIIVPQDEDFQKTLISAARQRDWYGCAFAQRIVIVKDKLNEAAREECVLLAQRLGLEICESQELEETVFS